MVPNKRFGQKKETEGEAGALGLIVALVYGTGLATTNIFLAQSYGIRDFSLLKPRAVFAGAIVLGTIALIPSGPIDLISRYVDCPGLGKLRNKRTRGAFALRLLLPLALLFATTMACIVKSEALVEDGWHFKNIAEGLRDASSYSIGLYLTGYATAIFSIQSLRKFRNIRQATSFSGIASRLSKISLYLAGAIISLSLYISLFTASLFESIPAAIGGPSSDTVELQVRKESVGDIKKLGVEFCPDNELLTKPLPLVYESEDQIYVAVFQSSSNGPPNQALTTIVPGQVVTIKRTSRVLRLDKRLVTASFVSSSKL